MKLEIKKTLTVNALVTFKVEVGEYCQEVCLPDDEDEMYFDDCYFKFDFGEIVTNKSEKYISIKEIGFKKSKSKIIHNLTGFNKEEITTSIIISPWHETVWL